MSRILLLGLVCCIGIAGCGKVNTVEQQAAVQLAIDTGIIHDYVVANNLTAVAKRDKTTGEYYIIDTLGTGTAVFTSSTLITVSYTGYILGASTPFTTTANTGFHPSFSFGQMIQGWQIGIPYIKKGGTVRLLIPSGYAYGPYEQPLLGLPANAILDFRIKLYDINN